MQSSKCSHTWYKYINQSRQVSHLKFNETIGTLSMSRLIFLILSLLLPFLLPQTNSSPLPLTVLPSPLSPSHSLTFSIGTPPTTVTLIIDTGSHHLALPCSNLKNEDIWFDVGGSETAEYHDCMNCPEETECDGDRCTHTQSYSEGN